MSNGWTLYSDQRPPEGNFEWRVKSRTLSDTFFIVLASMQWRNAGFDRKLAPEFAHWDGYRLLVPNELWWRVSAKTVHKPEHSCVLLNVEGVDVRPCPFCKKEPKWRASENASGGGVILFSKPQNLNTFWLECCGWTTTPRYSDPHKLAETRNKLLSELEK